MNEFEEQIRSGLRTNIISEIFNERMRQIKRFGYQDISHFEFHAILSEEVGEVARALIEHKYNGETLENYRSELVQVAATALQMIEELDRKGVK